MYDGRDIPGKEKVTPLLRLFYDSHKEYSFCISLKWLEPASWKLSLILAKRIF